MIPAIVEGLFRRRPPRARTGAVQLTSANVSCSVHFGL